MAHGFTKYTTIHLHIVCKEQALLYHIEHLKGCLTHRESYSYAGSILSSNNKMCINHVHHGIQFYNNPTLDWLNGHLNWCLNLLWPTTSNSYHNIMIQCEFCGATTHFTYYFFYGEYTSCRYTKYMNLTLDVKELKTESFSFLWHSNNLKYGCYVKVMLLKHVENDPWIEWHIYTSYKQTFFYEMNISLSYNA